MISCLSQWAAACNGVQPSLSTELMLAPARRRILRKRSTACAKPRGDDADVLNHIEVTFGASNVKSGSTSSCMDDRFG